MSLSLLSIYFIVSKFKDLMQQVTTLLAQQCWESLSLLAIVAWCMQTNATTLITTLNNSPFCPKLSLYLSIGPLTFFPQIICLYLTRPRGKSFLREGQSAAPPRGLTIFWYIILLAFSSHFCLKVSDISSNYSLISA